MEEQNYQNTLQMSSLAFDGNANELSHLAEDDLYQQYVVATRRNEIHYVPPPLPPWIHCQQMAHNYVEYLAESGVSEIQGEISYNYSGMASSVKPADSSLGMDAQKVRYLRPHYEGAPVNNFAEHQEQESNEGHCNASKPHSRVAVATPGFPLKPRNNLSKKRSNTADRCRRQRIDARLDALQELLPHSNKGGKASLLADIIDHVKYLQFQIKDLSQNRLGGEPTSNPFMFLEGYGHYLLHEQMLNEPLEEMMGKLLEVNPSAATQLLQSRGLFMMPMTYAEGVRQAT